MTSGETIIEELNEAHKDLIEQTKKAAEADRKYKLMEAQEYLDTEEGTVAQRAAQVEVKTNDLRYERKLQDDLRQAALELVRTKRQVLSYMQTAMNAKREVDKADGTTRHGENVPF